MRLLRRRRLPPVNSTLGISGEIVPSNPLWLSVFATLSNHVKAGDTDEDTVNRLWTKNAKEPRPSIAQAKATVAAEEWSLERLSALVTGSEATDVPPHSESGPPIVVRWKGRDYRIDGRRRIIRLTARGAPGPHRVLVIDVGERDA